MVFGNYNKWRAHPVFRITGLKDLKHVLPGFGSAVCAFAVYLTYSNLIAPAFASHDHHDHHDHHEVIKGASHARALLEQPEHKHGEHTH